MAVISSYIGVKGLKGIRGLDKVSKNLNKEIRKIKGYSVKGLIKAAVFICDDMGKTPPLVPKKTGNLEDSWKTKPVTKRGLDGLEMGFHANYAAYVHEFVGRKINWTRPNSGPKFLQAALNRNHAAILNIIRLNVKVR